MTVVGLVVGSSLEVVIFCVLTRKDDDGWACVGHTTTGYMGFSNRRMVFRCSPEHLQQHCSPILLAVSAVFADDVVLGKFSGCCVVSMVVVYTLA